MTDLGSRVVVDDRWRGEHGIGRFAREILARLDGRWRPLGGDGSPTRILDVVDRHRIALDSQTIVFSPGFNAGITRARQLLVVHDLIHLSDPHERSVAKTLYYNTVVKRAIRRSRVVMTVSETSARALSDWLDDPEIEIVVVGNGRSAQFTRTGARERFARPTFLYVGNLKPHKNVAVLLDALVARPEYGAVIVTSDRDEARELVRAMGLSSRVEIRGGIGDDELAELYRGATGVVQPSLLEGFGLPVVEAMSCGTRVAYWAGCESVREIVDGVGVEVGSPSDPAGWAAALDALVSAAEAGPLSMPAEWGARYDWDEVARKITRTVDRAASR
ncbi:glycosyltransferase family 4 protein [Compostimonas suwonensis]|uniref:Glycosyltransferase involved in cell wall biosynthesis n=1 Tax=Compostimonas suwonensis TaxID=1048394 RepID=A0A2M9C5D6_9MICO|nr:glycosyltransferase family 1 protein [Compostimonas suwonensis]PJJ65722.1 glycosyltransferase involved in cell wall biosynthesis [Compostimonas suwonensis]